MRKRMYWGITSLILIIGVVGVYYMLQPEPEPETRYTVPSEVDLEPARETKQTPPSASPNGHWHNGEWHDASHTNQPEQAGLPTVETLSIILKNAQNRKKSAICY